MKSLKIVGAATLLATGVAMAETNYDVVKRYQIIDDKLKTESMLRPFGEDFFLDIGATMNKNITDFMDDIKKAADSKDTNEAIDVLTKYEKTEQTVKINVNLGFPLPSFSAWDVNVKPNFRVFADIGANIGIRSQKLRNEDLINLFKEELPPEIRDFILNLDLTANAGADLNTFCATFTTPEAIAFCNANIPTGKYKIPDLNGNEPTANVFAKADIKAGLFNRWESGTHFFGEFNLYGMGRMDLYQFVTATQIGAGDKIEMPDELNTEVTLQTDFRFGYKNSNYSLFAAIEELKVADMSERKAGSKEHKYGYDALMRLHGEALFRTEYLSIKPFAGVHKRSEYDLADGWYLGTDFGGHIWGDRMGIQFRAMVDNAYFTLSPRVKLWIMQLEYSIKKPVKETIDDVKLSTLHSIDFRIFF